MKKICHSESRFIGMKNLLHHNHLIQIGEDSSLVLNFVHNSLRMTLICFLSVTISCVGPAEPEDGLVKDIPFVVNTESVFSFILKGDKYSFEETYDLSLSVDSADVITTTVSITDWSGSDTLRATIYADNELVVTPHTFTGNTAFVTNQAVTDSTQPKKAVLKGNNFKGVLEFVMAKN